MTTGQDGAAGRPLPGYVLRDLIGRGATSEVWRGEPEGRPGRVVAIKRLRTDADRAALEALRRDAEALARLSHPSILPILDIVEDDPGVAIITGYAAGGSLADRLGRIRGGLEPIQVADLGARIGAALAASHDAGIIHGGLKPANILFDAEGQPLVADLGASHLRGTSGPVIGTAVHLDPATIVDGRPSDATTDVYGLATTLYEALTGVPPHAGSSPREALAVSDRGAHIPAADLVEVPSDLAATIERGLRRDPAERFSTIAEMAGHLDEARRRLDTGVSAPRSRTPDAPRATPTGPDRRLLILAAAVIITIPGGIVTWMSSSDAVQAPPEEARRHSTEDPVPDGPPDDGPDDTSSTDPDPAEEPEEAAEEEASQPREAPPACAVTVTPALQGPTQLADIDGQGCGVPAAWDGQTLEVAIDGDLQRFDLPGDQQDTLLFGDFSCDGRETPALYRSSTGEVFVFPTLNPDDEITVRAEPDVVADAMARVVVDAQGCARVDLDPGTG